MEEMFDVVDEENRVIGRAYRSECHGNPALIHRAVHVLVFDRENRLLLQKRSLRKDIQPGKWDTSVGGHLDLGESYIDAARREMREELGICNRPLTFLYDSRIRNDIESENVATYLTTFDGDVRFAPDEIDEVRFWVAEEIDQAIGTGMLTPNFEEEWAQFKKWQARYCNEEQQPLGLCRGDSFPDLFGRLNGER